MIQITPQMRLLVVIEAVDGRKGIDSLARLCQEKLQEIHSRAACLSSEVGGEQRSAFLFTTARGSGWRRSDYRKGDFAGGRRVAKWRALWRRINYKSYWRLVTRRLHRPHRCGDEYV